MSREDRYGPLDLPPRTADESIADLVEGASALVAMAQRWNPADVKPADVAAADATLVGLARVLGELRRARQ